MYPEEIQSRQDPGRDRPRRRGPDPRKRGDVVSPPRSWGRRGGGGDARREHPARSRMGVRHGYICYEPRRGRNEELGGFRARRSAVGACVRGGWKTKLEGKKGRTPGKQELSFENRQETRGASSSCQDTSASRRPGTRPSTEGSWRCTPRETGEGRGSALWGRGGCRCTDDQQEEEPTESLRHAS